MRERSVARRVAIALVAVLAAGTVPLMSASATVAAPDVFALGGASFYGSTGNSVLSHPIVGVAATPSGRGYWLVANDGGIFAFGHARFFGSTGAIALHRPIVGMAATPSGRGYWLVASDGGIFAFGDARFFGSTGAIALHRPIVGIASTRSGRGYWLVASDGRVFARGDATSTRALGSGRLSGESIVGIAAGHRRAGFWLAASGDPLASVKAEAAIAWFEARMGSSAYEGRCETAVENAYGTSGVYPTAYDDWLARPDKHFDWKNAPRGALVFYDTSSAGHVAISLGDGYVVSTSIGYRIGVAPVGFLQNPLGWSSEPW